MKKSVNGDELLVPEEEHNKYFSEVLGLSYSESKKLSMFLSVINNKNYPLSRLTKLINFYRINKL